MLACISSKVQGYKSKRTLGWGKKQFDFAFKLSKSKFSLVQLSGNRNNLVARDLPRDTSWRKPLKDWEGLDRKWIWDNRAKDMFYSRHRQAGTYLCLYFVEFKYKCLGRFVLRIEERSLSVKVVQFVIIANDDIEVRFTYRHANCASKSWK